MAAVRPLPAVTLEADGTSLGITQTAGLQQVVVRQRLSVPTLCELTFSDPPGPLPSAQSIRPGTALRVAIAGCDTPLFEGDVTAVEESFGPAHSRELRVRGYDRLHRLRKQQNVRVMMGLSPLELARDVVSPTGVDAVGDASGPTWGRLVQYRQSDLRLLLETTGAAGLYTVLRGETLHLVTLEGIGEAVDLHWGTSLLEARVETNGDPATRSVEAMGWDATRFETWSGTASEARVGRAVAAEVTPASVGGSGNRILVDEPVPDAGRATALAQAELDGRVAAEVILSAVALGDPRLRPATPVNIDNIGPTHSGRHILTETVHTINALHGYITELSTRPPAIAERSYASVAVPGTVIAVDDPDGLGRVQVTFPTFNDIESPWMEVLSVGAGAGKGLVALPDVDDHVLVLLPHGDPAQGIVLGGLYGPGGPPDAGVVDGATLRYTLSTRGGQRITADDEGKELRLEDASGGYLRLAPNLIHIEDAAGSQLEMQPDQVVLHSVANLLIEAPGKAVVVRAARVNFEKG